MIQHASVANTLGDPLNNVFFRRALVGIKLANDSNSLHSEGTNWGLPGLKNRHLQHRRRLAEKPLISWFLGRDDEQASGSRPAPAA